MLLYYCIYDTECALKQLMYYTIIQPRHFSLRNCKLMTGRFKSHKRIIKKTK